MFRHMRTLANAEFESRRAAKETYTAPLDLKGSNAKEMSDFLFQHKRTFKKSDAETALASSFLVRELYSYLVPDHVSEEDFWQRYAFRCNKVRIMKQLEMEDPAVIRERAKSLDINKSGHQKIRPSSAKAAAAAVAAADSKPTISSQASFKSFQLKTASKQSPPSKAAEKNEEPAYSNIKLKATSDHQSSTPMGVSKKEPSFKNFQLKTTSDHGLRIHQKLDKKLPSYKNIKLKPTSGHGLKIQQRNEAKEPLYKNIQLKKATKQEPNPDEATETQEPVFKDFPLKQAKGKLAEADFCPADKAAAVGGIPKHSSNVSIASSAQPVLSQKFFTLTPKDAMEDPLDLTVNATLTDKPLPLHEKMKACGAMMNHNRLNANVSQTQKPSDMTLEEINGPSSANRRNQELQSHSNDIGKIGVKQGQDNIVTKPTNNCDKARSSTGDVVNTAEAHSVMERSSSAAAKYKEEDYKPTEETTKPNDAVKGSTELSADIEVPETKNPSNTIQLNHEVVDAPNNVLGPSQETMAESVIPMENDKLSSELQVELKLPSDIVERTPESKKEVNQSEDSVALSSESKRVLLSSENVVEINTGVEASKDMVELGLETTSVPVTPVNVVECNSEPVSAPETTEDDVELDRESKNEVESSKEVDDLSSETKTEVQATSEVDKLILEPISEAELPINVAEPNPDITCLPEAPVDVVEHSPQPIKEVESENMVKLTPELKSEVGKQKDVIELSAEFMAETELPKNVDELSPESSSHPETPSDDAELSTDPKEVVISSVVVVELSAESTSEAELLKNIVELSPETKTEPEIPLEDVEHSTESKKEVESLENVGELSSESTPETELPKNAVELSPETTSEPDTPLDDVDLSWETRTDGTSIDVVFDRSPTSTLESEFSKDAVHLNADPLSDPDKPLDHAELITDTNTEAESSKDDVFLSPEPQAEGIPSEDAVELSQEPTKEMDSLEEVVGLIPESTTETEPFESLDMLYSEPMTEIDSPSDLVEHTQDTMPEAESPNHAIQHISNSGDDKDKELHPGIDGQTHVLEEKQHIDMEERLLLQQKMMLDAEKERVVEEERLLEERRQHLKAEQLRLKEAERIVNEMRIALEEKRRDIATEKQRLEEERARAFFSELIVSRNEKLPKGLDRLQAELSNAERGFASVGRRKESTASGEATSESIVNRAEEQELEAEPQILKGTNPVPHSHPTTKTVVDASDPIMNPNVVTCNPELVQKEDESDILEIDLLQSSVEPGCDLSGNAPLAMEQIKDEVINSTFDEGKENAPQIQVIGCVKQCKKNNDTQQECVLLTAPNSTVEQTNPGFEDDGSPGASNSPFEDHIPSQGQNLSSSPVLVCAQPQEVKVDPVEGSECQSMVDHCEVTTSQTDTNLEPFTQEKPTFVIQEESTMIDGQEEAQPKMDDDLGNNETRFLESIAPTPYSDAGNVGIVENSKHNEQPCDVNGSGTPDSCTMQPQVSCSVHEADKDSSTRKSLSSSEYPKDSASQLLTVKKSDDSNHSAAEKSDDNSRKKRSSSCGKKKQNKQRSLKKDKAADGLRKKKSKKTKVNVASSDSNPVEISTIDVRETSKIKEISAASKGTREATHHLSHENISPIQLAAAYDDPLIAHEAAEKHDCCIESSADLAKAKSVSDYEAEQQSDDKIDNNETEQPNKLDQQRDKSNVLPEKKVDKIAEEVASELIIKPMDITVDEPTKSTAASNELPEKSPELLLDWPSNKNTVNFEDKKLIEKHKNGQGGKLCELVPKKEECSMLSGAINFAFGLSQKASSQRNTEAEKVSEKITGATPGQPVDIEVVRDNKPSGAPVTGTTGEEGDRNSAPCKGTGWKLADFLGGSFLRTSAESLSPIDSAAIDSAANEQMESWEKKFQEIETRKDQDPDHSQHSQDFSVKSQESVIQQAMEISSSGDDIQLMEKFEGPPINKLSNPVKVSDIAGKAPVEAIETANDEPERQQSNSDPMAWTCAPDAAVHETAPSKDGAVVCTPAEDKPSENYKDQDSDTKETENVCQPETNDFPAPLRRKSSKIDRDAKRAEILAKLKKLEAIA